MSTPRPRIPVPSPIRRLFNAFPLQTFPSTPLPSSCPAPVNVPRLFIHSATSDSANPSWDAECLKWQTFLRLEWEECSFVSASRHASPSGELPFLIQPTSPPEIVPLHKLHQLVVSKLEIPANSRATAYLNLVDTKIHAAWVYTFYMTEAFERVVMPLLELPDGPQPLQYLVRYSHRAARKAELERRSLSDIRPEVLLAEAEEGYAALSTLLGESMYFFNERRPGLLDSAVFAYTWTVLDGLGETGLASIIRKFDNLVRHADNLRRRVYSA